MKKLACCLLLLAFGARAADPPPPPSSTEYARLDLRLVRLHLLTEDPRVQLTDSSGRVVCTAPCNAEVPTLQGDLFTLGGPGLWTSDAFTLPARDTDVTLRVRAGTHPPVAGYVLMGAGGAVAGVSLLAVGFEAAFLRADNGAGVDSGTVGVAALGLFVAAIGAAIVFTAHPTQFTQD
jgi:hypothetical protein